MEKIKKVTTDELAIMINNGFERVEKDIKDIKEDVAILKIDVSELKTDVSELKTDVSDLKTDVSGLKTDVGILKTTMITKSYLDDKIADLKGEFVVKFRKEDKKVDKITEKLEDKKIFDSGDVEEIKSIEVFAKVV